jgi:hypothetical protein
MPDGGIPPAHTIAVLRMHRVKDPQIGSMPLTARGDARELPMNGGFQVCRRIMIGRVKFVVRTDLIAAVEVRARR